MHRKVGMRSPGWLVLLGFLALSVSCAKPSAVAGHYVCDRDRTPRDTLDLEASGAFTLREDGATLTGSYELKGDSLFVNLPGRAVPPMRLDGAVLIDQAGGRWTKQ
jgi:hypothetical protein